MKKPAVAEEFFPNPQAIGDPFFFPNTVHDSLSARTLSSPSVFQCHRDILWQSNGTPYRERLLISLADFLASRKASSPEKCPQLIVLSLCLSCSFI